MNLPKAAKLIIPIGIFIILLIISSFDFAASVAVSIYFFLSRANYLFLLIASPLIFIVYLLLDYLDINIRFISDLSIDAYILFATGVVLYLESRKDFIALFWQFIQFLKTKKTLFSGKKIFKLILSLLVGVLLLPISGGYIAVIAGYFLFSYIDRQFNGKIAAGLGLITLFFTAGAILLQKSALAEELGNYVFLFLAVGTFQEIINLARQKNEEEDKKLPEVQKEKLNEKISSILTKSSLLKINPRILIIIVILLILSFLLYFYYPVISKYKFSLSLPKLDFKRPTPTLIPTPTVLPSPSPSIAPTPISKVSTSAAQLKILVLNGTEITGLAGSTSAKLKKVGFKNIEIGNAKTSDYKIWEASLKKHDEDIGGIIKNVLELETLTVKEATEEAKFDIEIIVGENK